MSPAVRKRRAVIDGVKNVFWAFLFAVALWLVMAQSEETTKELYVSLAVKPPAGTTVNYGTRQNQPPQAHVVARGPRTILDRLEGPFEATYSVQDGTDLGTKSYATKDFDFHFPPGVEVEKPGLQPAEIKVDLAKRKEDELAVEPNLDRELPEGWEIESESIEPKFVAASGSIEEMAKNRKLTTQPLSLKKILERNDFDRRSGEAKEVEQKVTVEAPPGTGINVVDPRPVTLRIRVGPKPKERELLIAPAFLLPGPVFPGLPYKLRPQLPAKDKVSVRVSGPELMLADSQVEATKATFVVYAEVHTEDLQKGKFELGGAYTFTVRVIPPQGIKVLSFDDKFRVIVDPMETEPTAGGVK